MTDVRKTDQKRSTEYKRKETKTNIVRTGGKSFQQLSELKRETNRNCGYWRMFTTERPYYSTRYLEVYRVVYCPVHTHAKGNDKTKLLFCRALRVDAQTIQTEHKKEVG